MVPVIKNNSHKDLTLLEAVCVIFMYLSSYDRMKYFTLTINLAILLSSKRSLLFKILTNQYNYTIKKFTFKKL